MAQRKKRIRKPSRPSRPLSATLPARLRFWRLRAGLTGRQLAGRCDLTPSSLSNYEQGIREPAFVILERIAAGLHMELAELLHSEEPFRAVGRKAAA